MRRWMLCEGWGGGGGGQCTTFVDHSCVSMEFWCTVKDRVLYNSNIYARMMSTSSNEVTYLLTNYAALIICWPYKWYDSCWALIIACDVASAAVSYTNIVSRHGAIDLSIHVLHLQASLMRHQSWRMHARFSHMTLHVYDISQTPYDTRVQRRRRRKSASPHSGSRTVFAPGRSNARYSLWRNDTKTYRKLRLLNRSGISRFVQRWWALNVIGLWNLCGYGLSISQPVMSSCHVHKHKHVHVLSWNAPSRASTVRLYM